MEISIPERMLYPDGNRVLSDMNDRGGRAMRIHNFVTLGANTDGLSIALYAAHT